MIDPFVNDIANALDTLEDYVIREENKLIDSNAGDKEWCELDRYKQTIKNFQYLMSIYG